MIHFLRGIFHPNIDGTVVIETSSGMGFLVTIPQNSILYKNLEGDEVTVYTHMAVREDNISLFGFASDEELNFFRMLIAVSGIGAKAGIAIMSILPLEELKAAIVAEDSKMIATANGVGSKTAQRVILELKDKVEKLGVNLENGNMLNTASSVSTETINTAIAALMGLGYSKNEAKTAVKNVEGENLSSEDYIKLALRNM